MATASDTGLVPISITIKVPQERVLPVGVEVAGSRKMWNCWKIRKSSIFNQINKHESPFIS
jgi:hypothetical protein